MGKWKKNILLSRLEFCLQNLKKRFVRVEKVLQSSWLRMNFSGLFGFCAKSETVFFKPKKPLKNYFQNFYFNLKIFLKEN